nr:Chain C, Catenin beta-1 [Homo sapiens]
TTAPFLSGK